MNKKIRGHVAAVLLLAPAATFLAQPAVAAPQRAASAVEVRSLNLNADSGLAPGSTLQFDVRATPGSRVSVALGRTDIVVPLRETSAGTYRGTYVVRKADRIDPTALMTARVARGKTEIANNFSYPGSFRQLAQATPAALRIDRFAVQPVGRLEPGRELRLRVEGAPGATASFEIPGVVANLPLREVRPGHYEGSYTIRQRDDLSAFTSAVATLRSGRHWITSRLDRPFVRDTQPPVVSEMQPGNGEAVGGAGRTNVSARFDDAGSGVDPDSVRIRISGRDVTDIARIREDSFSLREDLPPGRHVAELTLRDQAGNATTQRWAFEVGTSMGAAPARGLPLVITSPDSNATVDANGRVTVQGRTAPRASVRVRVDAVTPGGGNRLGVAQTVLEDTVQADGNGYFAVRVPPGVTPLPGNRYEVSVTATQGGETAEQRIVLVQRVS